MYVRPSQFYLHVCAGKDCDFSLTRSYLCQLSDEKNFPCTYRAFKGFFVHIEPSRVPCQVIALFVRSCMIAWDGPGGLNGWTNFFYSLYISIQLLQLGLVWSKFEGDIQFVFAVNLPLGDSKSSLVKEETFSCQKSARLTALNPLR